MDFARLTDHLRRFTPFADAAEARLALASSLERLGFLLPEHLIRKLQAALPAECSPPLLAGLAATRLADQVPPSGASAPLSGQALERTQEVCAVLGKLLEADLVRDLVRELPPPLASALDGSAVHTAPDAQARPASAPGHHLSDAMVGSKNSLASGRPKAAHQASVAADNPHEATKLSSARGLTQEREGETLADGSGRRGKRGA